jgi:hypothetical protein
MIHNSQEYFMKIKFIKKTFNFINLQKLDNQKKQK